jgi:hypothetical protein
MAHTSASCPLNSATVFMHISGDIKAGVPAVVRVRVRVMVMVMRYGLGFMVMSYGLG